jgi:uncharacterized protein DUF4383
MDGSSPARLYALLVGAVLVGAGILGFFYESSFDTGDLAPRDDALGILTVNGWHNVVHLATGLLGLAMASTAARTYALGLGAVYVVVAILGFIAGDGKEIFDFLVTNTEDNLLHLAIGVVGLAAGMATPSAAQPPAPAT